MPTRSNLIDCCQNLLLYMIVIAQLFRPKGKKSKITCQIIVIN